MSVRKSLAIAIAGAGAAAGAMGFGSPAHAQVPQWAGAYVGASGGYGAGHQSQSGGFLMLPGAGCGSGSAPFETFTFASSTSVVCTEITTDGSYHLSGGLVGGGIGYNFQQDHWVLGAEVDDSWADISGSGICGFPGALPHGCGGSIRELGTVRGKLGYDVGQIFPNVGNSLVYIAGGLAFADIHAWDSLFNTSGDKMVTGWTFGGGIETKLSANWSAKLEYLYVDLGNPAVFSAIPPIPEHVSTTANIVRVGLSYYFSAAPPPAPPPVVTKAR